MSNAKNIASAIQKGSNVYVYDEKGIFSNIPPMLALKSFSSVFSPCI